MLKYLICSEVNIEIPNGMEWVYCEVAMYMECKKIKESESKYQNMTTIRTLPNKQNENNIHAHKAINVLQKNILYLNTVITVGKSLNAIL